MIKTTSDVLTYAACKLSYREHDIDPNSEYSNSISSIFILKKIIFGHRCGMFHDIRLEVFDFAYPFFSGRSHLVECGKECCDYEEGNDVKSFEFSL